MSQSGELDRLARRINWLDRFRRPLAILLAALLTPLAIWSLFDWLPANWPGAHMIALGVCVAVFAWYGIESFLGLVIAVWETDYSNLTRTTLPRAKVVRRK